MRENAAKMRTRITPNMDSFYAVHVFAQNEKKKKKQSSNLNELREHSGTCALALSENTETLGH